EPGPPYGTGGAAKRSWLAAGTGAIGPPAPGTGEAVAPGAAAAAPGGGPRRTACCGAIVWMLGSAPYEISSRIASRSVAYAARQNAVDPDVSARPQFRLPQPL